MTNFESIKSFLANVREQDNFEFTENGIMRFGAELSEMLLESVAAIRDDHKKERLRGVIKDVFELGDKDVVIFKQGEIFIKHFDQEATNQLQINKKVKDAIITLIEEKKYTEAEDTTTIPLNGISESVGISISDLTPASKEDIKQKLKKQIGLADKDLVLFLNDKIIIKQVKQAEEPEVTQKPTAKQQKKAVHVGHGEMSELRESIFESYEAEEEMIGEVIEQAAETEFDYSSFTYDQFVGSYEEKIKQAIMNFLNENLSEDAEKLEKLTAVLFKDYWLLVHTKLSFKMLDMVGRRERNVETFLRNYSGEIEVDSNKNKLKQPEILDQSGMRWNVPAIINVTMQRRKTLDTIDQKQKLVETIKGQVAHFYAEIDGANEELAKIREELAEATRIEEELTAMDNELNNDIQELREILKNTKEEYKEEVHTKIREKSITLKRLVIQEENAFANKKKLEQQLKITSQKTDKLKFEISKLQGRQKDEEERIKQFIKSFKEAEKKYDSLVEALALTLTKRKTKI